MKNKKIIRNNSQKGRIPLLKINYIKKDSLNIMSYSPFILKSLSPFHLSLNKSYPLYRREGVRLGRGKSKIKEYGYKIRKNKLLLKINNNNNIKYLKNILLYKN
jgi:hypothetical protein